jgi:GABA(A) receptor-associated protein
MSKFKNSIDLEKRKLESSTIRRCWPEKIPLIIEKDEQSNIAEIKPKFLCPINYTVSQFLQFLRKKIEMNNSVALYVATENDQILSGDRMMYDIYQRESNEDGFLYLRYGVHSAYGNL